MKSLETESLGQLSPFKQEMAINLHSGEFAAQLKLKEHYLRCPANRPFPTNSIH